MSTVTGADIDKAVKAARRAYEKAGFRDTGTRVQTHAGMEMEMAAPLTAGDRGSR